MTLSLSKPTAGAVGWSGEINQNFTDIESEINGNLAEIAAISPSNGDLIYRDGTWKRLAKGSNGQVLTLASGLPSWSAAASGGKLLQVATTLSSAVSTTSTTIPLDDTQPSWVEGSQFMSRSITPVATDTTLFVLVWAFVSPNSLATHLIGALFKDLESSARAATANIVGSSSNWIVPLVLAYSMTSGTTSTITFKFRAGPENSGTMTFNGRSSNRLFSTDIKSGMLVMEIDS